MRVFRHLALGAMVVLASAALARAQDCPSTCEAERQACQGSSTEITVWAECQNAYDACINSCSPVSEEIELEDPTCPEGTSCSIAAPDYDLLCLENGFGRHWGYIGYNKFRVGRYTIVICWWWI